MCIYLYIYTYTHDFFFFSKNKIVIHGGRFSAAFTVFTAGAMPSPNATDMQDEGMTCPCNTQQEGAS